MLLVREIMYCKPGKVRPMVEKFVGMAKLMEKYNQGRMKIMTDFAAERYWTIVSEFEVESMEAFEKMMSGQAEPYSAEDMKLMEEALKGYVGDLDAVRTSIELACNLVATVQRAKGRR